jgi:hypothetical protein
MRVATRPRPEINIGPVDLSCAFVVCDIEKFDLPIVYCSEMFERLTGYNKHEILGRNCRFLQAPDGKVQSGVKRKYVDDGSILYLKNQITKRAEAQLSLINYRKGGQPFMNLLTMIPIQFDSEDYKFYVGFQVDLVEQPSSVSGRNPGITVLSTSASCVQGSANRHNRRNVRNQLQSKLTACLPASRSAYLKSSARNRRNDSSG